MSGGRQRTLPQAWWAAGEKAPEKNKEKKEKEEEDKEEEEGEEADDDLLLVEAAAAADPSPAEGFCAAAGSIWIYPTNYPVRSYQLRMAHASLLGNTLVCLPTGLGKTFVAAVVMYNFYRCDCIEPFYSWKWDQGGTQALHRRELWATRRVFFLTPQVMVNDLSRGTCPAVEIKCLVIDEAHKALGNHAYCQVVRELSKYTSQFRILALSATPGSDTKAVQQVISNLLIAQIELCAEDSPEIQPYSHERQVEKVVVPLGEELGDIQSAYIRVLEAFAGRLIKVGVLAKRDVPSLTKYQIILARDQYRKNPSSQNMGIHQGVIEGDFALCISLYHGYELLLQMGLRSLFIYLCGIMDGAKGLTRTKNELGRSEDFMKLFQQLQDLFADTSLASANGNVYKSKTVFENKKEFIIYSHPKLRKLEEIVIEHFNSWKKRYEGSTGSTSVASVDTRVMIFSSFRDSVHEIAEMLSRLSPTVRVMTFVGHSTGKSSKGFTQKEQLEVVRRFREGGYNTLVSTCVGEEGLDIGEVDLIVCFDAQKSPVRLVQRMGRTGRRRQGRIVVILAEGREERTYNQSQCNKRSIHKALAGNRTLHFYQHSPRMVPEGINPKLHKMFITAEKYEASNSGMLSKERRSGSLQQKSALFSCVTEQKQTHAHEKWALSPEEWETWDRLYRIKESDGLKEPVLPPVRFETLESVEGTAKPQGEATQELSLSEWGVWQNHPFPTFLVGHSDRCYQFISIMEMIEQMRHQEGDCSYDLEIQPHLHLEDVHVPRSRSHPSLSSSTPSSRGAMAHRPQGDPFLPDTDDDGRELFTTFKTAKPRTLKRTCRSNLDSDASASHSARSLALPENAEQGSQEGEELQVTFDLTGSIDLWDSRETTHDSAATKACRAEGKAPRSLGADHADSGYSSFTAEKSPVSSDLFYLPESYVDSFAVVRPPEEPPWLKHSLSPVKRLLSQSPPSLNKLGDTETVLRAAEAPGPFQRGISESYSERLQDQAFPGSSEADCSVLLFENPELKVTSESSASAPPSSPEPLSPSEAAGGEAKEELQWDDSLDTLFSEEFSDIPGTTPAVHSMLTENPPEKCLVQKGKDLEITKRNVIIDGEKRVHLSEDEHPSDTAPGSSSLSSKHLGRWEAAEAAEQGSECLPSGLSWVSTHRPCEELPRSSTLPAMEVSDDLSGSEQPLDQDDLCDSSEELFSVTFDLGFDIQGCEGEVSEQHRNTEHSRESNSASRSHADVKPTEDENKSLHAGSRLETSPELDCKSLLRRDGSTLLPFQSGSRKDRERAGDATTAVPSLEAGGRRTASGSAEALPSALSTPTSRRGVNIEALRRIPMRTKSPHRQGCGGSAGDAPAAPVGRTGNLEDTNLKSSLVSPAAGASSESEEEVVFRRKNRKNKNVLKSPEALEQRDPESPSPGSRKRQHPLSTVSEGLGEAGGKQSQLCKDPRHQNHPDQPSPSCSAVRSTADGANAARQFLDEEAELSQQGADDVSSDESGDTENELNSSLAQFLNDDAEITQVLNDCEMEGVYLESVRSPALGSRYRMVHGEPSSMAIFSQVPEQDQSYAEDSFCVGEEEEETGTRSESSEEEVCVDFDLLINESFSGGRRQYLTRHRRRLKQARGGGSCWAPGQRKKPSRIIVLSDSSGEESDSSEQPVETDCSRRGQEKAKSPKSLPSASSAQHKRVAEDMVVRGAVENKSEMLLDCKASASERLDFHPEQHVRSTHTPAPVPASHLGKENLQAPTEVASSLKNTRRSPSVPTKPSAAPAGFPQHPSLCILADSREICSGAEVISSLKALHGVKVQVCSLSSGDYIVSSRLGVERQLLSELLSSASRGRVTQRLQRLQSTFERTCVIVEKDRVKAGEAPRLLQRTQHCDAVLAALLQAGLRLLFSSSQEETAALLKDLALLEQRKNAAIRVPTEVEGHKQEMLNFYLTIPNLSYLAALNMCHHFSSVKKMVNSSPLEIAAGAQVSPQKAEEIYSYLHHGFDVQMLPENLCAKGRSNT
ncbi:FANCM protein, partial [Galbula dea]|nr:FANCM protein [Galbula dea]